MQNTKKIKHLPFLRNFSKNSHEITHKIFNKATGLREGLFYGISWAKREDIETVKMGT